MIQQHAGAIAELGPAQQHNALMDAFPDAGLRHLFIAAGCWGITERGGTVPSEFYTGRCSILQVVRELGLRIIYALLGAVVQAKQEDTRVAVSVGDVNRARIALGMTSDSTVHDETILLSCPSTSELVKRAKQPAGADEAEDRRLIDANRARELMQKRLLRATADVLRNIHIAQGGSGERGDATQKRLAALYESDQYHELDSCLFLPRTKFGILIQAALQSIDRNVNRLSDGARSLIQLTCEEELLFVLKSAWTALRHYGSRKSLACEDICVMVQILKPVMKPLQATLPRELKTALDEADERSSRRLDPAEEGQATRGRGRGAGKARDRPRSRSRNSS